MTRRKTTGTAGARESRAKGSQGNTAESSGKIVNAVVALIRAVSVR